MLTIYKASAGSGKTYTLTYYYIKLLISQKDENGRYRLRKFTRSAHRSILAITFTNKATDEMKRRIIHELAVLGGMEPGWKDPSPYVADFCRELGCSEEELAETARHTLRDLLFDFNYFQVSTIDSFFQIILRTFAREAELTGNYEVDLENDRAMESGVRNLFESLRTDSGSPETRRIIHWLTRFLLTELREGRAVALFNRKSDAFGELLRFVKETDTEEFKRRYREMMDYLGNPELLDSFRNQLVNAPRRHKEMTAALCKHALDEISRRGYDDGPAKITKNVMTRLLDGAANGFDTSKKEGSTIASVIASPREACNAKLKTELDKNPDTTLYDAITSAFTALRQGRTLRQLWSDLTRQLYRLGLLESVYRYIEAFRAENNTLLLSDTNSILAEIIGDGETPFVFERLGVWLNHFLIDEFQDTSKMQWDILRPLVREGQATDADSLIIGDEKQCIYRFRSSDPTLLRTSVDRQFAGNATTRGDSPGENTNWRSSSHIVTFNNTIFSRLSADLHLDDVYSNVVQQISKKHKSHNGFIEATAVTAQKIDSFATTALGIMTESIRRQLLAGYKGKDICILVRRLSHGAKVISHLINLSATDPDFKGLRVISDDAMKISSAPAVRMIISILRYLNTLDNPTEEENDTSAADIRTAPAEQRPHRNNAEEIRRMVNRFEYNRSSGMPPCSALVEAIENPGKEFDIKVDLGRMACFSLPSLVERVIKRMLTDELESQCMYISAFQDLVTDWSSSRSGDLNAFLDWWDATGSRATVSAPDDENAIRVMTIHKSKGLEFACVHVPWLAYDMVDFKGNEWFEKTTIPMIDDDVVPPLLALRPSKLLDSTAFAPQYNKRCTDLLLDELNILYVALTRATEELSIIYRTEKDSERYPVGNALGHAIAVSCLMESADQETEEDAVSDKPFQAEEQPANVSRSTYGNPTRPPQKRLKPPTALDPVDSFVMPPYSTSDRDDLWLHTRIDDIPDFEKARDRGIIIHDVLAHISTIDSLPDAIRRCIHSGKLPREEADSVSRYLSRQISRPELRQWFEDTRRILCERPILFPNGGKLRPDRIVWTADGHIDIIDYKSGDIRTDEHIHQVINYTDAMRSMGYADIRGYLWYLSDSEIIRVC